MKQRFLISLAAVLVISAVILFLVKDEGSFQRDFSRNELNNVDIVYSAEKYADNNLRHHYFYNLVTSCTHTAVVAEYKGRVEQNGNFDKYINLEVIYGTAPDEYIFAPVDMTLLSEPMVGEKYVLTLTREDSIFYDFPIYKIKQILPLGNVAEMQSEFLLKAYSNEDFTDGGYFICKTQISGINSSADLVSYIKCIATTYGYDILKEAYFPNIFRGESLKQVVEHGDVIVKIKVNEVTEDAPYLKSNKYKCSVTEILKKNIYVHKEITVEAEAMSFKEGEEYIVILASADNSFDGKNFMQAANNGVIPLSDTALVEEFYECYMN